VFVGAAEVTFGPVFHGPDSADSSFVDPTVTVVNPAGIDIDHKSYVGPFATLDAARGPISIGEGSNVQDNALIQATDGGGVEIGDHVIVAHGVSILGHAKVGEHGGLPVFISFNAVVDGATLEPDTVVSALARVGPGVVIHAGTKVLPGKFVLTQAEADNPGLGKVTAVAAGDRTLEAGILEVNENFARGYTALYTDGGLNAVRGISLDPGDSPFNTHPDLPTLAGEVKAHPTFRNRIIGDFHFADTFAQLNLVLGDRDSFRADEGTPFEIGTIAHAADRVTVHALEHTEITIGDHVTLGYHTVIHGGEDAGNVPVELTHIGDDVNVHDWGVVFRSTLGNNVTVGFRALVDGSQLADNTVVADRSIIIDNVLVGFVEW
jgi:carbonic anhydrase/acetyltransferase-like protein (isoleucine patch superfamily)